MPDKQDRAWLRAYAVFVVLLTAAPYLLAFARQDADWVFTGFVFGVDDGNSYIAKMLAGASGDWLFRSPYTTVPQSGLWFVFLPYLVLGKLAAGAELHLQLVALFHLFRIAGAAMAVYASHDFIGLFEPRRQFRRLGTVLATLGGGLGWLLLLAGRDTWLGTLPLDFYSPETFGFLALFGLPHLAAGRALLLWALGGMLRSCAGGWIRQGVKSGLLLLGAGLFSPINPAIAMLVGGVFLGAWILLPALREIPGRANTIKSGLLAGLIALPVVGYSLLASQLEPFFHSWTRQNTILSPHPAHYLLAYGLYLPWAVRGARRLLQDRPPAFWLPMLWALLIPVLAYAPFNLQRRLPEAAFVALAVLAVKGAGPGRDGEPRRLAGLLPFGLAFPSTLVLLTGSALSAYNRSEPVFRPAAEVAAFEYLAEHAQKGEVVLTPLATGNALPAFAPLRVVIGHGPETIGFHELLPQVERFFAGDLKESEGLAMLEAHGVSYILAAPGDDISWRSEIPVYAAGGYVILQVRNPLP